MKNKKIFKSVLLLLILLGFFGIKIIQFNFLDYLFLSLVLFVACPAMGNRTSYTAPIKWFAIFVLLSCLYSWLFNHQALYQVIGHSYDYFALLFFFALIKSNRTYEEAETIMFYVALCFCFAYIVQWIVYPFVLFSGAERHADMLTEKFRIRMPGSICCYFLLLYSINKYLIEKRRKFLIYILLAFIPIIVQGFRSLVGLSAVASFLMIPFVLRSGKKSIWYGMIGVLFVGVLMTTALVQSKMNEMLDRQKSSQTFGNKEYIRYLSFDYYWNQQFIKPYEKIIGGGQPIDKKSKYKRDIDSAVEYYHFYWVDLGLIGLSMVIGVPAVLILVYVYLVCIWKCNEPKIQYIRFTLLVVLLGSVFTSMELYREGNLLLLSLLLYIEFKYHKERNIQTIRYNGKYN